MMMPPGEIPQGGSWANWTVLRTLPDPDVPLQTGETCGHCAERLLLRDCGIDIEQRQIAAIIGHNSESSAGDLVRALRAFHPMKDWEARVEPDTDDADRRFALYFPHWWVAMIKEYGRPAHWVVVRGCGDEETVEVRDSADATHYWVMWSEFDANWNRVTVRRP